MHGDRIVSEGRRSEGLHFIQEGDATVDQCVRDGNGMLVLDANGLPIARTVTTISRGEIFGELSLLNSTGLAEATITVVSLKFVAFLLDVATYERLTHRRTPP